VEHDEHIMIVQHNHLVRRSVGENTTNSSSGSPHATCVPGCIGMDLGNMLWYDRCIQRGKELIGIRMDLPGRALVGSRTGSSGQCEADPDRLRSDIKLNFGYVVEDINTHLHQKESPHLVG
jgi:hypothetical protein